MATTLPAYSPPLPCAPSYSSLPDVDEETVAYNPRRGGPPQHHGTLIRKWPHGTIILKEQDPNVRLATYGRLGVVSGEIEVSRPGKVFEVNAKFEGHMSVSSSDSGSFAKIFFSNTVSLWSKDRNKEERCPTLLPFSLQFPDTYEHEGKLWRIPPSFEATFLGIPALFARCTYTLSITITRIRESRFTLWSTTNTYTTLLNYRPRTRPYRPILHGSLFSSFMTVPEEWLQLMLTVPVRQNSKLKPVDCDLFIPSIQTYCITEPIPFHLQIRGSLESLRELLPATSVLLQTPEERKRRYELERRAGCSVIRIYIARQVGVRIDGKFRFRTSTIGTGMLHPVPPLIDQFGEKKLPADGKVAVDWKGEICCFPEVCNGGFNDGNLVVKDFLALAITPPNGRSSRLLPAQVAQSIKLVTDPFR